MVSVMENMEDAEKIRCCSIEYRRQQTFFGEKSTLSSSSKLDPNAQVPVVDLKPFTRKVWRRGRSIRVNNLEPLNLPDPAKNNKYAERKQIYRDSIMILAELQQRRLSENDIDKWNRQRQLRYPKQKPFPVKPTGFSTILDRSKTTVDDIKGGSSENIRYSLNKRSLGPGDFAKQRQMKLAGKCAISPSNSPRNPFPFPLDWKVSKPSNAPPVPNGPHRELTEGYIETVMQSRNEEIFHRRQLQPLNLEKSRTTISTTSLISGRERSFNVPFSCHPVSKAGTPKTFMERQDSLYEPSLGHILTKINYGARPDPGSLTSLQITGTRNVIMRTFGPPTQGEALLKLGMNSNLNRRFDPVMEERDYKLSVTPADELDMLDDDSENVDSNIDGISEKQFVDYVHQSEAEELEKKQFLDKMHPSDAAKIQEAEPDASTLDLPKLKISVLLESSEKKDVDNKDNDAGVDSDVTSNKEEQMNEDAATDEIVLDDDKDETEDPAVDATSAAVEEDNPAVSEDHERDGREGGGEEVRDEGKYTNRTFLTSPLDYDTPVNQTGPSLVLEDVIEEDDEIDNDVETGDIVDDNNVNDDNNTEGIDIVSASDNDDENIDNNNTEEEIDVNSAENTSGDISEGVNEIEEHYNENEDNSNVDTDNVETTESPVPNAVMEDVD